MRRSRSAALSLIVLCSVLPWAEAPAVAAVAAPTLTVDSAALVADGAGVRVQLTATCAAGDEGGATPTVTQAAGDRVAQGVKALGFICTGAPQQLSVLVVADVRGAPFHAGTALVTADLSDCPGANCEHATAERVLRIRR